jgi:hypothetical protein
MCWAISRSKPWIKRPSRLVRIGMNVVPQMGKSFCSMRKAPRESFILFVKELGPCLIYYFTNCLEFLDYFANNMND